MREGKLFVDRADIDDFAAGFGLHAMTDESLGEEEEALEINVEDRVKIGFGDIPEIGAALEAGVVDEDVQLAELRDGFGDEALAIFDLANVTLDGGGPTAVSGD